MVSIIVTTWSSNTERSQMMRRSILSLLETTGTLPVEIIVVDNGNDFEDSQWLLAMAHNGDIHTYIRNSSNLSFGIGRNQGFASAFGEYVVIADNDIVYRYGWLQSCISILEKHPNKKIYASQIEYPTGFLKERYDVGKLDDWNLNMRAGSNCFVIRRKDYEAIGGFKPHRIAGTKWTDRAVKLGYVCAVGPEKLCVDMGLRAESAYNHGEPYPFKRKLRNGEEVYLNKDEFKEKNPDLNYA